MAEVTRPTFQDHCIICCGMLHPEMTHLVETGFLNPRRLLFTSPGLHALPRRIEEHLVKRLKQAREWRPDRRIIVVYGKKCYVDADELLKMSVIAAQVSLYPLRQESIGPATHEAVRVLRGRGLKARVGEMSTLVWGEEQVIFGALQEAFQQAAESGDTVMTVTLSNACPSPEEF